MIRTLVLLVGLVMVGTEQARLRTVTGVPPPPPGGGGGGGEDLASLPLLDWEDNIATGYLGGATFPNTVSNGTHFNFASEGGMALLDADSFYMHGGGSKATVLTIPTLINSSNPGSLNRITYEQGFQDITEGNGFVDIGSPAQGWRMGGILLFNSLLYGAAYSYYDASNSTTKSHFKHSPTLATTGVYAGMDEVWDGDALQGNVAGFVSGYMAHVPTEWQTVLGGPAVTGNCCIPITSRTSNCPSLFAFNPADINVAAEPVNADALMYCAAGHDTWGQYNGATALWGGTATVRGVAVINNTRTTIFMGTNGLGTPTGTFCYGSVPTPCTDPEDPAQGNHAYPYRYQYWLIDSLQLAEVKAGTRSPWNVLPYAYGEVVLPVTGQVKTQGLGVMYDATNKKLYFVQARADPSSGDRGFPILHGWLVDDTP